MNQKYTSKDTSLNQISMVYKKIEFPPKSIILDYGGGKYDTNKKYAYDAYSSIVLVYDQYNRSEYENLETINYFRENPAKFVVCANVLNVLYGDNVVLTVLKEIRSLMRVGGLLYISVYERDKSGIGCVTTKGYQRNMRTKDYIPFIEKAFEKKCKIQCKKNILIVEKL